MSDLEECLDRIIDQAPEKTEEVLTVDRVDPVDALGVVETEIPGRIDESQTEESVNVVAVMLRRWYIVLATFVVLTAIGVPLVWYLVEPGYIVAGLMHFAPAQEDLLSGDAEQGFVGDYDLFKTTQAMRLTSTSVLDRVATELIERDLTIVKEQSDNPMVKIKRLVGLQIRGYDPLDHLKGLVHFGVIRADSIRHSQFVKVSMKSMRSDEAKIVVDSIMRNYNAIFQERVSAGELDNLRTLEKERSELVEEMRKTNDDIRSLADQYGTSALDVTQELMLQRSTTLLAQLADLEATRIDLESSMDFIEEDDDQPQSTPPHSTLAARNEYIAADPLIQELTRTIVALDQELVIAEQALAPENPAIREKKELLGTFKSKLNATRIEVGAEFDKVVVERTGETREDKIAATQRAIDRIVVHERKLKEILNQQEIKTREIGRTHMDISALQLQQDLNRELHGSISRRMRAKEMERKRDPVVTVDTWAEIEEFEDNRIKFSAGIAFGALGLGVLLAFLRDKLDKRLKHPEDVAKCAHIPLVGTVASSKAIKSSLFAQQIAGDYQAIRTNLELSGYGIPRMLAVASAGMHEGTTALSTNLATSLAKSGKRVLLVDGDLRKPEVLQVLDDLEMSEHASEVVAEGRLSYRVWVVLSSGLHVLVPDFSQAGDAYELLASSLVAERLELLSQRYDHIIIDTPPVLTFPDALIWAGITGKVVLSCFAGRTTSHELNEAKVRMTQTNAVILGAVMSNVRVDQGYQRYGHNYCAKSQNTKRKSWHPGKKTLLSVES